VSDQESMKRLKRLMTIMDSLNFLSCCREVEARCLIRRPMTIMDSMTLYSSAGRWRPVCPGEHEEADDHHDFMNLYSALG
jgi:hypothetical protein